MTILSPDDVIDVLHFLDCGLTAKEAIMRVEQNRLEPSPEVEYAADGMAIMHANGIDEHHGESLPWDDEEDTMICLSPMYVLNDRGEWVREF